MLIRSMQQTDAKLDQRRLIHLCRNAFILEFKSTQKRESNTTEQGARWQREATKPDQCNGKWNPSIQQSRHQRTPNRAQTHHGTENCRGDLHLRLDQFVESSFQSEVESRKNQVPKVRDRTYSETLPVAAKKPLIKPGKRRPTNGAQYTQVKLGKSIDACTLMGSLERQRTNSFNAQRPAKQKKTCQDTNNESLKV